MTITHETKKPKAPNRSKGERVAALLLTCGATDVDEAAEIVATKSPWLASHLADALAGIAAVARTAPKV